MFGAQVGYNWQFAPTWLVGLEGDWQWTGGKSSTCLGECGNFPGQGDEFVSVETKLKWLATFRGRIGWIHNDYLWYFTGGAAWGKVEQSLTSFEQDETAAPLSAISTSRTKGGYTVGGGVETQLWSNWTAKLEYLYVDLGTVSTTGLLQFSATGGDPNLTTVDTRVRDHIIRAGINYRFGGPGY